MALDIPNNKELFRQKDVRETTTGKAETTDSFVTTTANNDLTNERVLTAGEGIDLTDAGAGTTLTVSGKDATTTNKGIASFNTDDFSLTAGAVSLKNNNTSNYGSSGVAQNTTSTSYVDYTQTSATITTTGGSVLVIATCSVTNATADKSVNIRLSRDNATATSDALTHSENDTGDAGYKGLSIHWIDSPSAGSHTYEIQFRQPGAGGTAYMFGMISAIQLS